MDIQGWIILNFYTALLLVLLLIFESKNSHTLSGDRFRQLDVMTLVLLVAETIGHLGEMYPDQLLVLTKIGYYVIYALDPADYLFAILYINCWMDNKDQRGKKTFRAAFDIFVFVNFFLVTISALFDLRWFYYFDGNEYIRGPLFMIRGALLLIFCCLTSLYTIIYRKSIFEDYRRPIFALPTLAFVGALLQIFFSNLNMTYASISIGLLILFFLLQAKNLDIDYLTGVLNRRGLDMRLEDAVKNSISTGRRFSAIMLDLDRFKSINDNYGHSEGDVALKLVAETLHEVFPENSAIGRFGGDEFCVVTNISEESKLNEVIEIVKDELEIWNYKSNKPYEVEISTGGMVYDPATRMTAKEFQMAIDELMYQEKRKHHLKDNRRDSKDEA
ncbi:MAG: GGDEF domain-containing protein [Butyrivibrio sp.]|nr:GGDEF domain-containing protein [Butyrivibrio sp.]